MPTELVWDGTDKDGKKASLLRIGQAFHDVGTGGEGDGKRQGIRAAPADSTTAESASDVPQ